MKGFKPKMMPYSILHFFIERKKKIRSLFCHLLRVYPHKKPHVFKNKVK